MRRTIPLLTVILALQIGLAALLAVRKDPLAATTPQTPLIDTSLQSVDHVLIEGRPTAAAGIAGAAGTSGGAAAAGPAGTSAPLATVELAKQDGKWVLPGYFNAPVDKFKLNDVLDELSDLKRGLPVATTSSALERFKLANDDFERRLTLSAGKKVLSTVYFGSSTGARKTDARTARDHAVYDVDLATYELPTQPSDWFDAGILEGDVGALSQVDVTANGQATIELLRQTHPAIPAATPPTASAASAAAAAKSGATTATTAPAAASNHAPAATAAATTAGAAAPNDTGTKVWVDPSLPQGQQVDGAHVDALAQDIADLRVDGILGLTAQPQWQQDHPLLTLAIHNDKHPGQIDTWTISQPADSGAAATAASPPGSVRDANRADRRPTAKTAAGRSAGASGASPAGAKPSAPDYYVLKDSAQPWYFKLSAANGKQLLDASASAALLTAAPTTAGEPSPHAKSGVHGASRAHRGRRSLNST